MVAVRPVKGVPPPGAGAVVPIQYSPPETPAARPAASGSLAPFTVIVTLVAPSVGLGASVMPVKVGAVRSIRSVTVAVGPQLPAASFPWTRMVWLPDERALIVVSGMSAYATSGGEPAGPQAPSTGMNWKPVPLLPTVSMKPSAPVGVAPTAVMVAVTRTTGLLLLSGYVPLLGFFVATTPEVVGPPVVTLSVIVAKAPQLPSASCA